jgi:hypothetical protein
MGAEGVVALHKELENEYAQGKGIMFGLAYNVGDVPVV